MAFGILVNTTAGQISMQNMRSARLFSSQTVTGTSGNFTVSGFDATRGHIFVRPLNGLLEPAFAFDNDTKNLSWQQGFSTATQFLFLFLVIR